MVKYFTLQLTLNMDQNQTTYNLTQESDGTWTMTGVWVIDNFSQETCHAQSPKFIVNNDTHMYFRFLNYLNRKKTRVSIIVFFNSLSHEYPMDLTVRLLNSIPYESQEKTSHVIYSSSALRSYLDFDIRWSDLFEGNGFIDPSTKQLRIEFFFRHTLRPYELPLQTLSAPPAMAPAPRPMPIDDAKTKYGVVGILTKDGNECLNAVILLLYSIPYFRKLVYSINTFGYEGTTNRALPLQKLFTSLQLSSKAVSSDEFVFFSKWQSEHIAMTHLSEALVTVLSAVNGQINTDKFNQLFLIQAKKVISCKDINYESVKDHPFYLLEFKLDEKRPQTFLELILNYNSNPERIDEYVVKGYGAHTAYISNQITSFPYAVLVNIQRFTVSETGSSLKKIVQDLEIPLTVNFNKMVCKNSDAKPNNQSNSNQVNDNSDQIDDLYTLQALIVHSGGADNGRFHANIRREINSNKWLEFRSYEVCEIETNAAVNSTDSICLLYTLSSKNSLLYKPCNSDQIPPHVLNPPPIPKEPPFIVTIVTENDYKKSTLRGEVGCGMIGRIQFPAQRSKTVESFLTVISSHLNIPFEKINQSLLLWQVNPSEGTLVAPIDLKANISSIIDPQAPIMFLQNSCKTSLSYTSSSCGCDYSLNLDKNEIIIFIKFYWKNAPFPLQYICSKKVNIDDPVSSLYSTIYEKLRVDPSTPLIPFIEGHDYSANLLSQCSSFATSGIKNGDAIILECPIDIPDFKPKFDFGSMLPPVRQPPQFPQYDGRDISTLSMTDDILFMDLTMEHDENGKESFIVSQSVELYYDARHHIAVIGIITFGSSGPPQSYFKIPLSYPFDLLETKISFDLGTGPKLDFFEPTDDGSFIDKVIDRSKFTSLKPFLTKLPSLTKKPITIYIREQAL